MRFLSGLFGWLAERAKARARMQLGASSATSKRAEFYLAVSEYLNGTKSYEEMMAAWPWRKS
jgi:hypothetical protein